MKKKAGQRLRRWMIIMVILLAGAGALWWVQGQTVSLDEYLLQINRLTKTGDHQQALSLCDQAVQDYPQKGVLYEKKAQIYWSDDQADLAIRTLDYGYKQTGWEGLKQLRARYDSAEEEDVYFQQVLVGSSGAQQQSQKVETYTSYQLPEVPLPEVERPVKNENNAETE